MQQNICYFSILIIKTNEHRYSKIGCIFYSPSKESFKLVGNKLISK